MKLEFDITLPRDRFHLQTSEVLELDGVWGVMGPSGCGKTSLLRSLAGLESHAQGIIRFHDEVWQDSDRGVFVPPEKRRIGYMFQESRLFPHLDVRGNLLFAHRRVKSRAATGQRCPEFNDVVEQTGIEHLLSRSIDKLSGGEKQRVAIARTLLNAPSILFMDEPLASLDWSSKLALLPCLRELHGHFGIPVVMVSHGHEEMARLADRLLLLHQGRVVEKGSCRSLINRAGTEDSEHQLSVLEATVSRHDSKYPLTELSVGEQKLTVHRLEKKPGENVRMILPAHEVSIVLDDIHCTSVQNRIPVVIESISESGDHHALLSLAIVQSPDEQNLLALITRKSQDHLELTAGQQVFAHFKASGLEVV